VLIGLQVVSGLVSASILFLLAAGLSLIFGVCRVLNLAHGAFFMLATYLAYALPFLFGDSALSFWLVLLLGPLILAAVGAVVEVTLFRRIYGADLLVQLLPTIALIFIFGDIVRFVWGLPSKTVASPELFSGAVSVLGVAFPSYYGFIMIAGAVIAVALWTLVYRTRWGILIRAIAQDREMSASLGINEIAIYTAVFATPCGSPAWPACSPRRSPVRPASSTWRPSSMRSWSSWWAGSAASPARCWPHS
jgi:branched-subunit amino acid ABC-type transport system permease component